MCCQNFWKKTVSFVLTLTTGILLVSFLQKTNKKQTNLNPKNPLIFNNDSESKKNEVGGYSASEHQSQISFDEINIKPFKSKVVVITFKPRPTYTEMANRNLVMGAVLLKVKFLSNGKIGDIIPIHGLPDGLTESAIVAAKLMKFNPAMKNGHPVTVFKYVEYSFTIY